jgi:hypothetical protein
MAARPEQVPRAPETNGVAVGRDAVPLELLQLPAVADVESVRSLRAVDL